MRTPITGVGASLRWTRRYLCGSLALPIVTVLSCSAPRAVAPPALTDPDVVFAAVRAREAQIKTLRARFTAESRRGDERHSTSGVLLVRKPDRFRLRMMLPFGLTVFDYLRVGDREQVSLPLQDRVLTDPQTDDSSAFSHADLGAAFLRGADAFPGTCAPAAVRDTDAVIMCSGSSGQRLRRIVIDPSARIVREVSYDSGAPRLLIEYADYRIVDGLVLPFRISMQYPGRDMSVEIAIQHYEVNPQLSADLFQPPPR